MNNQKINFPPVLIDGKPASPEQLEELARQGEEAEARDYIEPEGPSLEEIADFVEIAEQIKRFSIPGILAGHVYLDCETGERREATTSEELEAQRLIYLRRFEDVQREQAKTLKAFSETMTRRGQMTREEWGAPVSWFDGSKAILCELAPDFDLNTISTLGEYQMAAAQAIERAIYPQGETAKKPHPKAEVLRAEFYAQTGDPKLAPYLWPRLARCDAALGATGKWRVSTVEKVRFEQEHPDGYTLREYRKFVQARRRVWARETKRQEPKLDLITPEEIAIWTSQETDAYTQSASHGLSNANWRNEPTSERRVWERPNYPFRVEIDRKTALDAEPLDWEQLEKLTGDQNTDFALAFFYVASCLSPAPGTNKAKLITGKIDLNDLMLKIGWLAQKPDEATREQLREKIWRYLVYGEEAILIGARSTTYRDPVTKKEISTRMESAAWKIIDRQRPEGKPSAAPLWVELVIGRQWEAVFSDPRLAQYMPLGELLGAIPPNKVGGDWARAIGLTLAKIWRCKPREAKTETLRISRREILTHFTPKIQTVEQLLSSNDPKRAVTYYREALNILLESGLIAPEGDAAPGVTPSAMGKPYGRQGWGEKWLCDACNLRAGPKWAPVVEERADALPPKKPRNLAANAKRRKPKTD